MYPESLDLSPRSPRAHASLFTVSSGGCFFRTPWIAPKSREVESQRKHPCLALRATRSAVAQAAFGAAPFAVSAAKTSFTRASKPSFVSTDGFGAAAAAAAANSSVVRWSAAAAAKFGDRPGQQTGAERSHTFERLSVSLLRVSPEVAPILSEVSSKSSSVSSLEDPTSGCSSLLKVSRRVDACFLRPI